jgi:hypothetical protein
MTESTYESLNKHVGVVVFGPFADLVDHVLHSIEVLLNGEMSNCVKT